jgi:sulfatase modifying factor 1
MRHLFLVIAAIALLGLGTLAKAVTIETVAIGDKGNTADTQIMSDNTTGYGSVSYNYNIGKYEVTAEQYTAFLNAVANVSDVYGLYDSYGMQSWDGCKIQRTSVTGGYSYSVASDYANLPVNNVSYWDACRFVNWLNNGQGNSSTETGAYTLDGYTGTDGHDISRNAGASWALTSEDEWYKAAHYKGGGAYSLYPNGTDVAPVAEIEANYNRFDLTAGYLNIWDGTINGVSEQNGTKDMMGNVCEFNEAITRQFTTEDGVYTLRGLRGGSWEGSDYKSSARNGTYPFQGSYAYGFRVVQIVPEPSSIIALLGGLTGLIGLRRRKA